MEIVIRTNFLITPCFQTSCRNTKKVKNMCGAIQFCSGLQNQSPVSGHMAYHGTHNLVGLSSTGPAPSCLIHSSAMPSPCSPPSWNTSLLPLPLTSPLPYNPGKSHVAESVSAPEHWVLNKGLKTCLMPGGTPCPFVTGGASSKPARRALD